ncbi:response regulator transcription factor [bacterium]|nr:response regulator transcription factor [bacterium]
MSQKRIVLFIDQSVNADRIENALLNSGFHVFRADTVEDATILIRKLTPHALIADWDLSDEVADDLTALIREECHRTGLILLSHEKALQRRIEAMENGADDSLVKPEDVDEMVAKVKAIVRRIDMVSHEPKTLTIRDITINLDTHEVYRNDHPVDLTYTQFKLLYLLASQRETVFSREEILEKVWGENTVVTDRTVDVHVKRLREKLGEYETQIKYIQTIHGMGYRFA